MNKFIFGVNLLGSYPRQLPGRFKQGVIYVTLLTVAVTILDGIGLALIVPLVEILIDLDSSASEVSVIRWVETGFEALELELSIGSLVAVILTLQAVRVIGIALQLWLSSMLSARYSRRLRVSTYEALLDASWLHFTAQKSGELFNALIPQSQSAGATIFSFTTILAAIFTTTIYFATVILISLELSLAAAGYTVLAILVLSYFLILSHRIGKKITSTYSEISVESTETFGGMKAIKAAGLETHTANRFTSIANRLAHQRSLNGLNQGGMQATAEAFFLTAMVLGLLFATHTVGLPAGALLLFALIFVRLFQRAKGVQSALLDFFQLMPALTLVRSIHHQASSNAGRPGGAEFTGLNTGMQISDVSFTYPGRASGLENISINVPSGDSVAIVGPSGAGKTTIIDLIVGLIDPSSGNIRVGEQLLTDISLNSWRTNISYVTQGTVLFNDTLGNNISLGHEEPDLEMLATVSQQSGVDQFIDELPDGYDTVIGERGVRLSGGQRQRIALARALYRQPQLLILDEATSELDNHSERLFQETIDQLHGDLTILMVAHRLSTVMNVDNLYVLDQGKIVESGNPSELLEARGMFHAMINESADETNGGESTDGVAETSDDSEPDQP